MEFFIVIPLKSIPLVACRIGILLLADRTDLAGGAGLTAALVGFAGLVIDVAAVLTLAHLVMLGTVGILTPFLDLFQRSMTQRMLVFQFTNIANCPLRTGRRLSPGVYSLRLIVTTVALDKMLRAWGSFGQRIHEVMVHVLLVALTASRASLVIAADGSLTVMVTTGFCMLIGTIRTLLVVFSGIRTPLCNLIRSLMGNLLNRLTVCTDTGMIVRGICRVNSPLGEAMRLVLRKLISTHIAGGFFTANKVLVGMFTASLLVNVGAVSASTLLVMLSVITLPLSDLILRDVAECGLILFLAVPADTPRGTGRLIASAVRFAHLIIAELTAAILDMAVRVGGILRVGVIMLNSITVLDSAFVTDTYLTAYGQVTAMVLLLITRRTTIVAGVIVSPLLLINRPFGLPIMLSVAGLLILKGFVGRQMMATFTGFIVYRIGKAGSL